MGIISFAKARHRTIHGGYYDIFKTLGAINIDEN